jgi:cytochrome c oxidase subunit 2
MNMTKDNQQTFFAFWIQASIDRQEYFTQHALFCFQFNDQLSPGQFGFQEAATPIMEGIISLHNDIMGIIVFIMIFVSWMLIRTLFLFNFKKNAISSPIVHGTTIELLWTILPAFILMFIAVPSFALLYSMDAVVDPALTIKAIGHQWYWSYEYSDYNRDDGRTIEFDSYMVQEDDLESGHLRLLEVDNRVMVPDSTHIRVLVTSGDVIHSWAVPSLGVKTDAIPGRLNQTQIFLKRRGVFHGQCSELCGVNHGFMPIVVESVSMKNYVSWVHSSLRK